MFYKMTLILGVSCLYFTGVLAQQFVPPFRPVSSFTPEIQRRQFLTPVQQTHILSDIQQHQHRFNLHQSPGTRNVRPVQNQRVSFVQQPSVNAVLPSQSQPVTFLAQSPAQATRQLIFVPQSQLNQLQAQAQGQQQQILQHHTQTSFIPNFSQQPQQTTRLSQRTVQNQISHNPQFKFGTPANQQQKPHSNTFQFPLSSNTQTTGLQEQFPPLASTNVRFSNAAPATTNTQQTRFPTQQFRQQASQAPFIASQPIPETPTFASSFPTNTQSTLSQSNSNTVIQIQPSIGNQVETIITETRPDGQSQQVFSHQQSIPQQQQFVQQPFSTSSINDQSLREKQRLIQKHEQFFAKQYQKELTRAEELHQEFLRKQQAIQQKQNELRQHGTPLYYSNIKGRPVQPSDQTYFQEAVKQYNFENPTTTTTTTTETPTTKPRTSKAKSNVKEIYIDNPDDLGPLLSTQKDKLLSLLSKDTDASISKSKSKAKSTKALGKEDLLKQLKLALANNPQDLGDKEVDSMDVVLPNGQKVQVIRTSDPDLIRRAGADPSQVITQSTNEPAGETFTSLEELQKNLPEGADFEVIKQTSDGRQEVVKLPPKKKVTFVYLEEQNDGSFKVQGVKTDKDKDVKTEGAEVDGILKRIKNGEIKLPPPSSGLEEDTPISETPIPQTTVHSNSVTISPFSSTYNENRIHHTRSPSSTTRASVSKSDSYHSSSRYSTAATGSPYSTLPTFLPTQNTAKAQYSSPRSTSARARPTTTTSTTTTSRYEDERNYDPLPSEASELSPSINELSNILKNNGLHAMAKYLKQSGLDTILNETGPYTIFVPTDKAFKSLLVQLGGPDRAEEKFKNNPRLLSGLLLHHVIPGAFEIASLQDEMTGVSLAGTQLRVNQYTMQDPEWNDVTLTTINGAMIATDKQDIAIPQGIAHAIDRVMFPLPVGDVLQTLQSDRERRFTHFLRALFTSGMADTLQNKGVQTYTVFAPTDAAFDTMPAEELTKISADKTAAEEFVKKHVVQGTLFTAGMRFYQVKESMADGKSVTLQKNGGKIRVNDSTMVSSNIPATNGVIHIVDNQL